jgi:hypothetical protein
LKVDRPRTDWIFWLSLAMEVGLGTAALVPQSQDGPTPSRATPS